MSAEIFIIDFLLFLAEQLLYILYLKYGYIIFIPLFIVAIEVIKVILNE